MKKLILAAVLAFASSAGIADDDSDIISGCALSNAEFGTEMIQVCINENNKARAELKDYPEQYKGLVERCTRRKEMGWGIVKKCVDDDIAAIPVLENYARDHGTLVAQCREEFWGREISRVRLCVETALKDKGGSQQ
ncbi:MAG TPA: hypothetical protein VHB46_12450 [Burkholderiales bacterium]|nr:hypothetical protein [Burkholderiales bacterium]